MPPLLSRELIEQSNRKRLYWLRILYVLVPAGFLIFFCHEKIFSQISGSNVSVFANFSGMGEKILPYILFFQYLSTFLILPSIMAGAISKEKEANTLQLLFLTRLAPWQIIIEKFFSRMIPMLAFQVILLPIAAIAYSFGGLPLGTVISSLSLYFAVMLFLGALSLFCSVFCENTTITICTVYAALIILAIFISNFLVNKIFLKAIFGLGVLPQGDLPRYCAWLVGSASLLTLISCFSIRTRNEYSSKTRIHSSVFRATDSLITRLNRSFCGGILLGRASSALPEDEAVLWREMHKRNLHKKNYMLWTTITLSIISAIIVIVIAMNETIGYLSCLNSIAYIICGLSLFAVLYLSLNGYNCFAEEKRKQTLDILLTTPLDTNDILNEKTKSFFRLLIVTSAPIIILAFLPIVVFSKGNNNSNYFLIAMGISATLLLCFNLSIWTSCAIGLIFGDRIFAMPLCMFFSFATLIFFIPIFYAGTTSGLAGGVLLLGVIVYYFLYFNMRKLTYQVAEKCLHRNISMRDDRNVKWRNITETLKNINAFFPFLYLGKYYPLALFSFLTFVITFCLVLWPIFLIIVLLFSLSAFYYICIAIIERKNP